MNSLIKFLARSGPLKGDLDLHLRDSDSYR
jgi:hypothetical protein